MHGTRTRPIASQRDVRNATQHFGHAAGPWLAVKERQQSAIAASEHARFLKQDGVSVPAVSIFGRMRHAVGAALVRTGLRLQATAGQPAGATPQ